MKLFGTEVPNKNVAIGGGIVLGIVGYTYWKRKNRVTAPTATDGSTVDPNAIDPSTGIPYGQETGYAQSYFQGTVPNPYVSQTGTSNAPSTSPQYTTNTAWLQDGISNATNLFGVSFLTASGGLGKYLSQNAHGLNGDEYQAVSEVVALQGHPPVGGPYRLIQGATPPPAPVPIPQPQPSPVPIPSDPHAGMHWQDPQVATLEHGRSLYDYWRSHYAGNQAALQTLQNLNPGLGLNDTTHGNIDIRTSDGRWVPN